MSCISEDKLKPKYIIRNNKTGEQFSCLDINLRFPVESFFPSRNISIIYVDDIERVKCVSNYYQIKEALNSRNKEIVYKLNDSFDIFEIDRDNSEVLKKVTELRALVAHHIDPDYCTINGSFEFEMFYMDTYQGCR